MGVERNDVVHMVVGNVNVALALALAVWRIGAVLSQGDVNLEDRSIANQVNKE